MPAAETGTISISFVRPVVDAVHARALDVTAMLREAGISPELLAIPQARVSAQHYSALWRIVIRELDDEFFGQDSRRMKPGSFALMSLAVVHCNQLRAALERCARFLGTCLDDVAVEISEQAGRARITLHPVGGRRLPTVFGQETLLVMVNGLACWLVGRRIPMSSAGFAYPNPAHGAEYGALFCNAVRFEQPHTFLEFDASLLELPIVQNEQTAKEFLRIAPENILVKYKNNHSVTARIRRRLRQALPRALPDLEALAREMHTAPATLRRKLRAEGHSYRMIKDDLRRDLAITYLGDTQMSVAEISRALGFLEPSAFHRAFRKWTRASPGAYRRRDAM